MRYRLTWIFLVAFQAWTAMAGLSQEAEHERLGIPRDQGWEAGFGLGLSLGGLDEGGLGLGVALRAEGCLHLPRGASLLAACSLPLDLRLSVAGPARLDFPAASVAMGASWPVGVSLLGLRLELGLPPWLILPTLGGDLPLSLGVRVDASRIIDPLVLEFTASPGLEVWSLRGRLRPMPRLGLAVSCAEALNSRVSARISVDAEAVWGRGKYSAAMVPEVRLGMAVAVTLAVPAGGLVVGLLPLGRPRLTIDGLGVVRGH